MTSMNRRGRSIQVPRLDGLGILVVCIALFLPANQAQAFQTPATGFSAPHQDQAPQLIPRTHDQREQRFLTQHRIILNVQVTDSSGKPSIGLAHDDFTLYDNDQPQKLVAFSSVKGDTATASPHVIVVFDTVNNFSRALHSHEKEVEKFLKEGEGPLAYPLSIGVFSGTKIELGESTRDREALLAELRTRAGDLHATGCINAQERGESMSSRGLAGSAATGGFSAESSPMLACLNNRFIASVTALRWMAGSQVDVPGRVILIWIGSGWPQLTNHSFAPDSPEVKQSFFAQLVSLSTALREAQIMVNAVASPENRPYPEAPPDEAFFDGIAHEDQVRAGNLGLHAVAHQTGGRILTDRTDVAGQIRTCMADADSYYVLTFDSSPAAGFGEFHSLSIKVGRPGLDVRTNTHYYAEQ